MKICLRYNVRKGSSGAGSENVNARTNQTIIPPASASSAPVVQGISSAATSGRSLEASDSAATTAASTKLSHGITITQSHVLSETGLPDESARAPCAGTLPLG